MIEQNQFARALLLAERRKACVFLDLLAETRADIQQRVDAELRDEQARLSCELRGIHKQLTAQLQMADSEKNHALIRSLKGRERENERAYQINEAEIRRRNPRYAALTQPEQWDVNRLQKELLDENTILLEYVLDEPKSWLFAVSTSELEVFSLPPRNEIETCVEELCAAITKGLEFSSPAFDLYQALIKPAEELIREKQLLIVADEELHKLPFATLLTGPVEKSGAKRFDSRPYLTCRHAVAYAPSAAVAGFLKNDQRQRPRTWRQDLIAFAFSESRIGPDRDLTKSQLLGRKVVSARMRSSDVFRALPWTREEVGRIVGLFDGSVARDLPKTVNTYDSKSVKIRLGIEATKPAVLSFFGTDADPQPTRFVHFATHGVVDLVKPQFSGLIFNPSDDGNPFWQTFEIFNARIPSDLVVLSACETGLGKVFSGEGLVGLARAFFYAGAASVCATLWAVDDESSADLMEKFYGCVLNQPEDSRGPMNKAQALRQAQLDLVNRGGEFSHPSFWAAFVLIGGWD